MEGATYKRPGDECPVCRQPYVDAIAWDDGIMFVHTETDTGYTEAK